MKGFWDGVGWLFFALGVTLIFRGCNADTAQPMVGQNGWLYNVPFAEIERSK